ncbi:hypothetical protein R5R35_014147 [Gryllus longicercus]|uniref:Uncharacterized protein n=1 Tax=Gryllus longicercus TaxID=2509291 RepID=A0AAN9YY25_9ORTH
MSKKTALKETLEYLTYDNILLEKEIVELQIELSLKGKRQHCFNLESDEDDADTRITELDYKKEKHLSQLSTIYAGINFVSVTRFDIDMKIRVYRGVGELDYIRFDFQFEIEEERLFQSIIIKFESEALEKELGAWRRGLSRKRDFMQLISGISSYSNLLSQMKEILFPLKDSLNNIFEITFNVTGCVAKTKKILEHLDAPVLIIYWKIVWNDILKTMEDSFTLEIPDSELFAEAQIRFWSKFCKRMSYSFADIRKFWIALCDTPELLR